MNALLKPTFQFVYVLAQVRNRLKISNWKLYKLCIFNLEAVVYETFKDQKRKFCL